MIPSALLPNGVPLRRDVKGTYPVVVRLTGHCNGRRKSFGELVKNQQVENAKAAVELFEGVVYVRWVRGAVVGESDAHAVMARVSVLCSGNPRPMLVDMDRMEGLEHRARNVFAARWPLTRIAVVGVTPVDRAIVGFYVARHSPVCPTRFFTSRADAMTWLGAGTGQMRTSDRLLAEAGFPEGVRGVSGDPLDADALLNVLLERLEAELGDIGVNANGMPLFMVEMKLTDRLREVLPGVRFTAQDIRTWSAMISS